MSTSPPDPTLRKDALERLRSGDAVGARARFDAYLQAAPDDHDAAVMQSAACVRVGDQAAAHATLDRVLAARPDHLRALLAKADLLAADGALREANLYYRGLLQHASGGVGLAPDVADGLSRARAMAQRLESEMSRAIDHHLEAAGYSEGRSDPRFTHALDLLRGRREVFVPQPKQFYYPELQTRQFYPRDAFPWLDAIEAATEAMTEELVAVLAQDDAFSPYVQSRANMPTSPAMALLTDSMTWSAAHLIRDGVETPLAARCPRTMAALAHAPLCRIPGRSPQAMFSQLRPGAHIVPHHGFVNTRLICHVPLVVPEGCWFRVGNETRAWECGKAFVFDDTIEHEARNESDQTRVVLIFDIWRPELSQEERALVATLLETLDAFSPEKTDWQ